jgi:hypothetical protein
MSALGGVSCGSMPVGIVDGGAGSHDFAARGMPLLFSTIQLTHD